MFVGWVVLDYNWDFDGFWLPTIQLEFVTFLVFTFFIGDKILSYFMLNLVMATIKLEFFYYIKKLKY